MLDSPAPSDHHYYDLLPSTMETHAMRRISKEHRILQEGLPANNVFVRSWEARLDLLRVLIVGARGTPYELAPLVFDIHLHETFPASPPKAYFHSWTDGRGRLNPNLYEDGTICLSLLGTWPADEKNEGWSPKKSSVLQVIMSIIGLVLVKEPYYSKPIYYSLLAIVTYLRSCSSMVKCV